MKEIPAIRKQIILGTEFPDAIEAMVMRCESRAEVSWLNNATMAALDALHWKTQLELSTKQSNRVEELERGYDQIKMAPGAGDDQEPRPAKLCSPAVRSDTASDIGSAAPLSLGDRRPPRTGTQGDG